ncbi:MAG: HAMP domain-containing histidine kinase [Lachnospiraceae bacterium]|jgi:signal transduction histidine kinase|nr:HAMP domain-containing histidine kinase [Lachnospiraceae bacterium]
MSHSIRLRFTVIFLGLTLFGFAMIWVVNNWYLEGYYLRDKVSVLEGVYKQLNQNVMDNAAAGKTFVQAYGEKETGQPSETSLLFKQLSDQYNLSIVILNFTTNEILTSSYLEWDFVTAKLQRYLSGDFSGDGYDQLVLTENYTVQKTYDPSTQGTYLESSGYFEDGQTFFILSTPLAGIKDSVDISNRFLIYVGLAVMLVSFAIIYVITGRITLPIKELAQLSQKISDLDFTAKYTGVSQDEIGVLGRSMNKLSERLEETIEELRAANLELTRDIELKTQVDEMRKEFIANVSHELKTPIALIQGYAEGLTEGMASDEESRNYYCHVIMDEAGRMNKMVKELLALSAIESGNDQPVMGTFDLAQLAKDVVASMEIVLSQKGAKVIFEAGGPVYVVADEFKIKQVIINMLNNAINHLDGAMEITVGVGDRADGAVDAAEVAGAPHGSVRLFVHNTGAPIPDESLEHLWTKFYKVDKARTRAYGGTGIGLSIVKAILDSHHQGYGVYNTQDGVTFWFTLEKAPEGTPKSAA